MCERWVPVQIGCREDLSTGHSRQRHDVGSVGSTVDRNNLCGAEYLPKHDYLVAVRQC
jgi:hypothetical protein